MVTKTTIALSRVHFLGNVHVGLDFSYNYDLAQELKAHFPELRWNPELRLWHLPYRSNIVGDLFQLLKGRCWIEYQRFYQQMDMAKPKPVRAIDKLPPLDEFRQKLVGQYKKYLLAKRYAPSTIKTYSEALSVFFRFFPDKPIDEIDNNDLIHFSNAYILKNQFSQTYQNQVVNAIKLFYRKIQNKKLDPEIIERPRAEKRLPNVLSKEEVKAILGALDNLKHRTMLCLIYACGLRRGELLKLKIADIDSKRGVIFIHQSKGKKDRLVPVSEKTIEMLRTYYVKYRPQHYLFEGQEPGTPYSEKSIESVMKMAREKSGIKKDVTLHWLRHCYATHLMENGTDVRIIQELLGHKSSKTTEIYTHVSTRSLQQVRSPFDDM